jgi:hypothetical protein
MKSVLWIFTTLEQVILVEDNGNEAMLSDLV